MGERDAELRSRSKCSFMVDISFLHSSVAGRKPPYRSITRTRRPTLCRKRTEVSWPSVRLANLWRGAGLPSVTTVSSPAIGKVNPRHLQAGQSWDIKVQRDTDLCMADNLKWYIIQLLLLLFFSVLSILWSPFALLLPPLLCCSIWGVFPM